MKIYYTHPRILDHVGTETSLYCNSHRAVFDSPYWDVLPDAVSSDHQEFDGVGVSNVSDRVDDRDRNSVIHRNNCRRRSPILRTGGPAVVHPPAGPELPEVRRPGLQELSAGFTSRWAA